LRGNVLKVGGVKEKVLGAYRAGIKTVILPAENQGDLEEVPVDVRTHMIFAPVDRIEQVLELVLDDPAVAEAATAAAPFVERRKTPRDVPAAGSKPWPKPKPAAIAPRR
jgi:ATP-dependent Lon protease